MREIVRGSGSEAGVSEPEAVVDPGKMGERMIVGHMPMRMGAVRL